MGPAIWASHEPRRWPRPGGAWPRSGSGDSNLGCRTTSVSANASGCALQVSWRATRGARPGRAHKQPRSQSPAPVHRDPSRPALGHTDRVARPGASARTVHPRDLARPRSGRGRRTHATHPVGRAAARATQAGATAEHSPAISRRLNRGFGLRASGSSSPWCKSQWHRDR